MQQNKNQPNPRFNQYTQIIKNDQVVGFKLDNNEFEFLFDKYGGWFDEEGKYYNIDAIQCDPPEESSDSQSEAEQKVQKNQLTEQLMKINVKDQNQRIQIIRQLTQIVQSYPQGKPIRIIITLQPSQKDQKKIIEEYLNTKFNQKLKLDEDEDGLIEQLLNYQLAVKILQLQGTKLQSHPQKPTIYVDVQLYDSLQISVLMPKKQLQDKLIQMEFQRNVDYANLQEEQYQKGKFKTYVQIRRDIEQEIVQQGIDYKVQAQ